jgi:hypothetical protein
MTNGFSPRVFLRQRGALLVHFNTVMGCEALPFPTDLQNAMRLKGVALSFSTIQLGDTNPHAQGRGGAEGSVGILVDLGPVTVIKSVCHTDSGSSLLGSLGLPATAQSCADSIDKRTYSNEWHVQDYVPVGVFFLPPIFVRGLITVGGQDLSGEKAITLADAMLPFPQQRLFSANATTFLELDRQAGAWKALTYDDIIAP